MKQLSVIIKSDLQELLRGKILLFGIPLVCITCYFLISISQRNINALSTQTLSVAEVHDYIKLILGTSILVIAFLSTVYVSVIIQNFTLVIEKKKQYIESILATTLSVKKYWIGKSIAIWIPGILLGLIASIATVWILNIYTILPEYGIWIFPNIDIILAVLIGVPLLTFIFCLLYTLLQLIVTNTRVINGILGCIVGGSILGTMNMRIDVPIQSILPIICGVGILSFVFIVLVSRLLTKERIILSSKG